MAHPTTTADDIILCDDGTLDTVFECRHCGNEIRYSEVERDPDTLDVLDSEFKRIAEEHDDEVALDDE